MWAFQTAFTYFVHSDIYFLLALLPLSPTTPRCQTLHRLNSYLFGVFGCSCRYVRRRINIIVIIAIILHQSEPGSPVTQSSLRTAHSYWECQQTNWYTSAGCCVLPVLLHTPHTHTTTSSRYTLMAFNVEEKVI